MSRPSRPAAGRRPGRARARLLALALALLPAGAPAPAAAQACGECHGLPPASGAHPKHAHRSLDCAACHGEGYRGGLDEELHRNGRVDLSPQAGWTGQGCASACHRPRAWAKQERHGKHGERGEREREGHGEKHGHGEHDD